MNNELLQATIEEYGLSADTIISLYEKCLESFYRKLEKLSEGDGNDS